MSMSSRTREMLEGAGWKPGRKVDISEYERAFAAEGYALGRIASEFLEEFGGLVVHCGSQGDVVLLRLDLVEAVSDCWPGNVATAQELVNESLVVIGEAWDDNGFLFMSESGRVYLNIGERLIRVGDNGCEALETLCEGIESRMIEIPQP